MLELYRSQVRYSMFGKAKLAMKGEDHPDVITTHVCDISDIGLGVFSCKHITLGAEVSINIEFIGIEEINGSDTIEGRVVWIDPKDNFYYMGILFREKLNPYKQPNLYGHFHGVIKKIDRKFRAHPDSEKQTAKL